MSEAAATAIPFEPGNPKYQTVLDREHYTSQDVCRARQRPSQGGRLFPAKFAGESLIIVRESETRIAAHFNVCRHRGYQVGRTEKGNARFFTCGDRKHQRDVNHDW
jgi:phenylpropionate dioxygenase-like ring-hydroxylating dioxygenase large terminal subunit